MAKLLLVDDNEELRDIQAQYLREHDHVVVTASNGVEAIALLQHEPFDLVITDVIMPRKQGMEIVIEMREAFPRTPVIAISGGGRIGADDYLTLARKMGAAGTLTKPFSPSALLEEIKRVLAAADADDE